ncbi:MAG: TolC family protein [Bacteroidales bacterium]|nr:TolC family protein [Bacteroidales bacterium]
MKKLILVLALLAPAWGAWAQYQETPPESNGTLMLTLEDALKIALSENTSVKVADLEIKRTEYAKRGTYASLFPQVSGSGSFQRTIKKQVMYMGFGGAATEGGIEIGRSNTWSAGLNATMPVVNAQLWESICMSADQVELAVEQARESRLGTVTSVKQAFYAVLLAKESFEVYKVVYENALENYKQTELKYNAQKAPELDLARAKSTVAAAIPNVYNAESGILLSLWQLKAVMGIDLDRDIDVAGSLDDYAEVMFHDLYEGENASLERNTTLRQLDLQAEQLAKTVRSQQFAYIPTLSLNFTYSVNAMADNFNFNEYRWTPYSYVGLSLSIPIFSGGQRYYAIKQTRTQASELSLQRENTERQLRIGIRQSLQTMETAMKTYDSAREAVQSAEKAYDIAAKSYKVGRSTLTDLNNTELTLTQTRLQAAQAVYNFVVAKASLEQTLGYDFTAEE